MITHSTMKILNTWINWDSPTQTTSSSQNSLVNTSRTAWTEYHRVWQAWNLRKRWYVKFRWSSWRKSVPSACTLILEALFSESVILVMLFKTEGVCCIRRVRYLLCQVASIHQQLNTYFSWSRKKSELSPKIWFYRTATTSTFQWRSFVVFPATSVIL